MKQRLGIAQAILHDPEEILSETRAEYRSVQDFSAKVLIRVNVDFIKIPDKTAHIIFRYPDKIKIKSKSFIMIPKKGIGFMIFGLLESEYSTLYAGTKVIEGRELKVVKMIPVDEESDLVLVTLYIHPEDKLIYNLDATVRDAGSFTTTFEYGEHAPLPEINRIHFEVDRMKVPLKFLGKADIDPNEIKAGTQGEVILQFDNAVYNQSEHHDSEDGYINLNDEKQVSLPPDSNRRPVHYE